MNYYFWLGKEAETPLCFGIDYAKGQDRTVITDGFGNFWDLCEPDCKLEVVRPGKVQCKCDFDCEFCGQNSIEFHLDPDPRWPQIAGWFCSNCGPYPDPQQNQ